MAGLLFDTSVYIDSLRRNDSSVFSLRRADREQSEPLYLSSVVLEELYLGALNRQLKKLLAKFENDFEKINRLLVPNQTDWTICGQVLSAIDQKYGFESVRRARMTNDCLIAMTAARCGLTVISRNAADFRVISEFREFKWTEVNL